MADSSPLLPQSRSPEPEEATIPSLNDIIERTVDKFSLTQLLQAALVSLSLLFDGQQAFISVFTDAVGSTTSASFISTFISDWGLQNATSFITGLPTSSFFMGCLIGGFSLAPLADSSLGRKNLLLLSCALMCLPALLVVFATNVWIYSALRFLSGFGRSPIGTCALVLSTEIVGKRWRGQVGILGFFCFTLGFLSLPAIAYANRLNSWKSLYFWTSLPTILYCPLLYFLALESPRWLYMQGRAGEAVATLTRIAPVNQTDIEMLLTGELIEEISKETIPNFYALVRSLLGKRWALRRLAVVMVAAFGIGMVYYGMPLGVEDLGFSTYLSTAFNALSEIPAFLLTFFFIGKWERTGSLVGFAVVSGVCSVGCVAASERWEWVRLGSEVVSFSAACGAYAILLIYTLELFPTSVRNSATSMVRQAQVFGAAFSPLLVAAGRGHDFVFYGVLGLVIIFCGSFVVFLPETKGTTLCDSMDEQECKDSGGVSVR
ncbi:organic cation/carnitine transporter 3-like [Malania oleifera]|uniref:organic cation/carnitine transporter 3-like n=1 Tax=Malania oleifera TaxID=397392 RepID=UPI0025AE8F49|nr:organic cation/carnitine transporter 3-like [Malania oleifera]